MLSLTVYLVSNYKTKLKVCCLLFWVNLAQKKPLAFIGHIYT